MSEISFRELLFAEYLLCEADRGLSEKLRSNRNSVERDKRNFFDEIRDRNNYSESEFIGATFIDKCIGIRGKIDEIRLPGYRSIKSGMDISITPSIMTDPDSFYIFHEEENPVIGIRIAVSPKHYGEPVDSDIAHDFILKMSGGNFLSTATPIGNEYEAHLKDLGLVKELVPKAKATLACIGYSGIDGVDDMNECPQILDVLPNRRENYKDRIFPLSSSSPDRISGTAFCIMGFGSTEKGYRDFQSDQYLLIYPHDNFNNSQKLLGLLEEDMFGLGGALISQREIYARKITSEA